MHRQKIKVRIRENAFIAALAAKKLGTSNIAVVFGHNIFLHNTSTEAFLQQKRWVLHEIQHVAQYRKYGFFPFLFLYIYECLKNGYPNNRFEIDARAAETNDALLQQYELR